MLDRMKWNALMAEKLNNLGIHNEETSYKIDDDIGYLRNGEWESFLKTHTILTVQRERDDGVLILFVRDQNGVKVPLGHVRYFDDTQKYESAITLGVFPRKFTYKDGRKATALEYNQPVLLIAGPIPNEIILDEELFPSENTPSTPVTDDDSKTDEANPWIPIILVIVSAIVIIWIFYSNRS